MSKLKKNKGMSVAIGIMMVITSLTGCGQSSQSGKLEVELVNYKPEAVGTFEMIAERFNATHDDIHLTIDSPNEAMTILKTRFDVSLTPVVVSSNNLCKTTFLLVSRSLAFAVISSYSAISFSTSLATLPDNKLEFSNIIRFPVLPVRCMYLKSG